MKSTFPGGGIGRGYRATTYPSGVMPLTARLRRAEPYVRVYLRQSPVTFAYLFVLLVTTWVLRTSTVTVGQQLLWQHSTNLTHLRHDPVSVLITSAFWLNRFEILAWLVLFPLVLAPAEKWLGPLRLVAVFAIGHVAATLLTAEQSTPRHDHLMT